MISLADIDTMIDAIKANADLWPEHFVVSTETMRRLRHLDRLGRMYRVHPAPHYQLRKCHMRKLQSTWRKGKARIHRIEQAEKAREEELP
jgi:hypothetical protein